jgi:pimeloyl-ACP methyl ester carboxylesterase
LFIKIQNSSIHYKISGSGDPIILLHGWGRNIDYFSKIIEHLSAKFTVYALDLPGFGLSTAPENIWGSDDYAEMINHFIKELQIKNPVLLGHSFGGKIAINLVGKESAGVKKLILIGSAGIQLPKSFKVMIKIFSFKILKIFIDLPVIKNAFKSKLEIYQKKYGSRDYQNTTGVMRSILVKTLKENVISLLSKIKIPVLLLWGDEDSETPLAAGKILHERILNSQLKIIMGSGHFPFLDNWEKVKPELDRFLV